MKTFFYNVGYFCLEALRIVRRNPLSNLFSVLGTGLILFLLGLVLTGWSVGDQIVKVLEQEAEISAYLVDAEDTKQVEELVKQIRAIEGVTEVRFIPKEQARLQMEQLLGEEANILSLFEENPFEAFLEVRIDLDRLVEVANQLKRHDGIEYIRDNREVLEQMKRLTEGLKLVGVFISLAVGMTTLIIISHMIRQGIYDNREQINTLRLLGAPGGFIGFPFVLAGCIMTMIGGIIAAVLLWTVIHNGYRQLGGVLPFIPLPGQKPLQALTGLFLLIVSAGLGVLGSLFGLSSMGRESR